MPAAPCSRRWHRPDRAGSFRRAGGASSSCATPWPSVATPSARPHRQSQGVCRPKPTPACRPSNCRRSRVDAGRQALRSAAGAEPRSYRRNCIAGIFARSPSEGFDDFPAPTESGRMMKYFVASSGWPAPNNSPGKGRRQHASAGAGRAVQYEHRLPGRRADRRVVHAKFRHGLAGVEAKIPEDDVAFDGFRIIGGKRRTGHDACCNQDRVKNFKPSHAFAPRCSAVAACWQR